MIQNRVVFLLLAGGLALAPMLAHSEQPAQKQPPRLVLQITVDALRGDLPARFAHVFGEGGFRYLMEQGVHYTNAHYQHANTETIVGHVSLATGTVPAAHGMVGNVWFDRADGRLVYNIEDERYPLLTAGGDVDRPPVRGCCGRFPRRGLMKAPNNADFYTEDGSFDTERAKAAYYEMGSVDENDGKRAYAVTVKDVPVDAFWSITVYNADGYLEKNEIGRNSLNNSSATPNEDGSFTIHFGGDPKSVNYLPITEGWNYAIRMYQPRKEILDGSWTFPKIEPVK